MPLTAAPRPSPGRAAVARRAAELRANTAFAVAGIPLHLVGLLVLAEPWLLFVPVSLVEIQAALFVPVLVVALMSGALSRAQRKRFRTRLGIRISAPPAVRRRSPQAVMAWLRSAATWRMVGYHLLAGPWASAGTVLALLCWIVGTGLTTVMLWIWLVPPEARIKGGALFEIALFSLVGALLLLLACWLTGAAVRTDTRAALWLLGPSRAERLQLRVDDLTEKRAGVVDAADAERRRIERDLHDGAQQRLVSLALNLGLARATLPDLPEEARQVIDEAHREAKEAISELRTLVRGLHPAVLEDRGLDAALSGIAARSPVPVRLTVDLPERPSPTVEAVAYFVVSEALANVARHAEGATGAEVHVHRRDDVLRVVVVDDGPGGADSGRGTGLSGLAKRAGSVDGTFSVDSPVGGPTTVTVELPCAP
ncbi:sensor histidine kinase [Streptomyces sp. NPDC058451]|uniref:sensor histidine kinase n=1 Tax=Streptomyces sp. NPDC058451 TaxID=3346506 RepID=UPI00364DBFD5